MEEVIIIGVGLPDFLHIIYKKENINSREFSKHKSLRRMYTNHLWK
jgi:hypothetical protein